MFVPQEDVSRPLSVEWRGRSNLLRLSVTDRCNFSCRYCAPTGGFPKTPYQALPSLDALADAAFYLARRWKVRGVKVTGGEPLLRPGLLRLIERLASDSILQDISLTTNGTRLKNLALPLKNAGLKRINVSLDTLEPTRFRQLCGGTLSDTLEGIEAALVVGLKPLKLNAVLRRDGWRNDVPDLIDFAASKRVEVRFIELMPVGPNRKWAMEQFLAGDEVMRFLESTGDLKHLPHHPGAPAREMLYSYSSKTVKIGLIASESAAFCAGCNRLRLDSRGRLRRCLMDPVTIDLIRILESQGEEAADAKVESYLSGKQPPRLMQSENPMIVMGG